MPPSGMAPPNSGFFRYGLGKGHGRKSRGGSPDKRSENENACKDSNAHAGVFVFQTADGCSGNRQRVLGLSGAGNCSGGKNRACEGGFRKGFPVGLFAGGGTVPKTRRR